MERSDATNWRRVSLLLVIALLSWPAFIGVIAWLAQRGVSKPLCILLAVPLALAGFTSAIFASLELRPFRAWRMTAVFILFMCYGAALVKVFFA